MSEHQVESEGFLISSSLDAIEQEEIKELLSEEKKTVDQFILRPVRRYEFNLIRRGLMSGSEALLISRALSRKRDLSSLVLEELAYGYYYNSNVIVVLQGMPGTGKSIIAMSLATILQELSVKLLKKRKGAADIFITFRNEDTIKKVSEMRTGDIVVQDEIERQVGTDANTVLKALFNIQEEVRADQLCFFFCSPTLKGMQNVCNLIIEPFGINFKMEQNRFLVYSPYTQRLLGWAIVEKCISPLLEQQYSKLKKSHIDRIKRSRGHVSAATDYKVIEAKANELYEYCKTRVPEPKYLKNTILDTYLGTPMVEFHGSSTTRKRIVSLAIALRDTEIAWEKSLKDSKKELSKEGFDLGEDRVKFGDHGVIDKVTKHGKIIFKNYNTKLDKEFLETMWSYSDEAVEKLRSGKVSKKHLDVWKQHYVLGVPLDRIAVQYNVTAQSLCAKYKKGGWLAKVDEHYTGYMAEKAVQERYFPELLHLGGNSNADLVDDPDKPNIMVEVKKRNRKETPADHWLSAAELDFLSRGGRVFLVQVVVKPEEAECLFYEISYEPLLNRGK